MQSNLIAPNGRPIRSAGTTAVTPEAAVAIVHRMIDVQLGALLDLGVPPVAVVEQLIYLLGNILARFEPADARRELVDGVVDGLRKDVADKARRRTVDTAVKNGATR